MEEQVLNTNTELENTTENIANVNINTIHADLGVITCFLVFFALFIILKYSYKFFNMIFQF